MPSAKKEIEFRSCSDENQNIFGIIGDLNFIWPDESEVYYILQVVAQKVFWQIFVFAQGSTPCWCAADIEGFFLPLPTMKRTQWWENFLYLNLPFYLILCSFLRPSLNFSQLEFWKSLLNYKELWFNALSQGHGVLPQKKFWWILFYTLTLIVELLWQNLWTAQNKHQVGKSHADCTITICTVTKVLLHRPKTETWAQPRPIWTQMVLLYLRPKHNPWSKAVFCLYFIPYLCLFILPLDIVYIYLLKAAKSFTKT